LEFGNSLPANIVISTGNDQKRNIQVPNTVCICLWEQRQTDKSLLCKMT